MPRERLIKVEFVSYYMGVLQVAELNTGNIKNYRQRGLEKLSREELMSEINCKKLCMEVLNFPPLPNNYRLTSDSWELGNVRRFENYRA